MSAVYVVYLRCDHHGCDAQHEGWHHSRPEDARRETEQTVVVLGWRSGKPPTPCERPA